jgi:signal transduction histidine kinase
MVNAGSEGAGGPERDVPTGAGRVTAEERLALGDLERLALPPGEAARAQLLLVASLTTLRDVSLWRREPSGELRCLEHVRGRPSRGLRKVASEVLAGRGATPAGPRRTLLAAPVGAGPSPMAALAARAKPGTAERSLAILAEAASLLACVLERDGLMDEAEGRLARATGAAERRLARFGLDLHDGPAQEIAMLRADIELFGGQLQSALGRGTMAKALEGRVQDLEARALAVSDEIREVARMASVPGSPGEPVVEVLRAEVRAFARTVGVEPELQVEGPVDVATHSQRIALLRGVQEALRNASEHAQPKAVSVRVVALESTIEAEIRDDGRGFEPRRALSRANANGRLGLIGIAERARLLGGSCNVVSRPGGPTSVRISLPRWDPDRDPMPGAAAPRRESGPA